jgi:hypothetical protein
MVNDFDWVSDIEPMKPEMEFLKDNFDNLEKVIKGDQIYYVDSERKPLFMYEQDSEDGYVLLSYGRIWSVLGKDFGLKRSETEELIKRWLGETYNLMGLTPLIFWQDFDVLLGETYNLMGFTPKFITPTLNLTKSYLSSNK